MTDAVFFDVDGTLVDSNGFHIKAWERAFAEAGHAIAVERIAAQIGKGADHLVPTLIPGIDDDAAAALGERQGAIFKADYRDRVGPFPQARDLVARAAAAGLTVALASSGGREDVDHYTDLLDLRDLIDHSTSGDDADATKPSPDIFHAAREATGIAPGAIVVIGDTPYDMTAARDAGMGRIALRSGGFDDAALTEGGAQAIYDDVAALLAGFDASPLATG